MGIENNSCSPVSQKTTLFKKRDLSAAFHFPVGYNTSDSDGEDIVKAETEVERGTLLVYSIILQPAAEPAAVQNVLRRPQHIGTHQIIMTYDI